MKSILREIAQGQCSAVVADLGAQGVDRADVVIGAPGQTVGAGAFLARIEGVHARVTTTGGYSPDPEACGQQLDLAEEECRTVIDSALGAGADGISYRITGADPSGLSPMEYGGLVLERERGLLADAMEKGFVEIVIEPTSDAYYDFLSDLPCHLMSAPGASDDEFASLTELRAGPLARGEGTPIVRKVVGRDPEATS